MELPIVDFGGQNSSSITVPEELFLKRFIASLVQQVSHVSLACGRQGTRAQKNRAQVHHSTKKLFRQKGTGRARGGHSSTNIRRGGGRAFPAMPDENFSLKINRKMFRSAMSVILSKLVREERFSVVRTMSLETAPKTKEFITKITDMKLSGRILLVDVDWNVDFILSCRNVPNISLISHTNLLPTDLLKADQIIFSESAIKRSIEVWHEACK